MLYKFPFLTLFYHTSYDVKIASSKAKGQIEIQNKKREARSSPEYAEGLQLRRRMLAGRLGCEYCNYPLDFNNPPLLDLVVFERVGEACRRWNSSIHGTVSSPGFITESLAIVLLSLQCRLDCLRFRSSRTTLYGICRKCYLTG